MSFDIQILDGILGTPRFDTFRFRDNNPIADRTKWRLLSKPNPPMREIHRRFRSIITYDFSVVSEEYTSAYYCAVKHAENRFFYQTDLKHAYQSVRAEPMVAALRRYHADWNAADLDRFLRIYCFAQTGGLIVGAPASPDLFRIYAEEYLDNPLMKIWLWERFERGVYEAKQYTRYCDDLTFSSSKPIPASLRRRLRTTIEAAGFTVNDRKTVVADLKRDNRVVICGIGLAWRPRHPARVFLPRHYLKKIRGALHLAFTGKAHIGRERLEGMWNTFSNIMWHNERPKTEDGLLRLNATETKLWKLYHEYSARHPRKLAR